VIGENPYGNNPNAKITQNGAIVFDFQAPTLQTLFTITDYQINFPALELVLKVLEPKKVFSYEIEVGWIFQVVIGGFVYLSETVITSTQTYENTEETPLLARTLKSLVKSIQINPSIDIVPSNNIEVRLLPFFFCVKEIKPQILQKVTMTTIPEGIESSPSFQPIYARMIYNQQSSIHATT
jgi:hypothetical protein